jgi:hypothetical protein
MSSADPHYVAEATRLVEARIQELQRLKYLEASALPEADGIDIVITGKKASITTFRQDNAYQLEGKTLLVVLVAKPGFLGMSSFHIERGLVFSPHEEAREATALEIQNSGG